MKRSFGAFFDFGDIIGLVRGGTGYFTAWLYTILIGFAGSVVASVLPGTGVGALVLDRRDLPRDDHVWARARAVGRQTPIAAVPCTAVAGGLSCAACPASDTARVLRDPATHRPAPEHA